MNRLARPAIQAWCSGRTGATLPAGPPARPGLPSFQAVGTLARCPGLNQRASLTFSVRLSGALKMRASRAADWAGE